MEKILVKNNGGLSNVIITMLLASLSVIVPLVFLKSVFAVFFLYYIGMCLVIPFIDLVYIRKLSVADAFRFMGLEKENLKPSVLAGLIHGLILFAFIVGGFVLLKDSFLSGDIAASLNQWGVTQNNKWIIFVVMILFNGFVEEIFWRGYTYGRIRDSINRWLAIFTVTFFYTSYHLATILSFFKVSYLSFLIIFFIFAAGFIWGWMRFRFANIWASAIGHSLVTAGYMTIYLLI